MSFLAIEPEIVARLRAAVDVTNLKVLNAADLAGMQAAAQHVPAVHVIFDGFATLRAEDYRVEVVERWLTVIAVRNVASAARGEDARADAGPIMDQVFAALLGFQAAGCKPLIPTQPPRPGFAAGYGYFPLAWLARAAKIAMPCPSL